MKNILCLFGFPKAFESLALLLLKPKKGVGFFFPPAIAFEKCLSWS